MSLKYLYEERITLWECDDIDEAIELAENEAGLYMLKNDHASCLKFYQAYWLDDEIDNLVNGSEMYSLLRESDLNKDDCLDRFFDTNHERCR